MEIDVTTKNMKLLEVFSSGTRVRIIEMLGEKPMNIKDMAGTLGLSSAIVTRHIQQLEAAGIVRCDISAGTRGTQKLCRLNMDSLLLKFRTTASDERNNHIHSIPVGQYHAFSVAPTCGLSSDTGIIGIMDDPRYFADPEHTKAGIIWFGSGWVEYRIPNYLSKRQTLRSLDITLEICSEAPGFNEDWPSDITFFLNGHMIGIWTSPGDFGRNRGIFTPAWWNYGTQYGLLKTIRVNETGGYIDGVMTSKTTVGELGISRGSELLFRISNPDTPGNAGGVTIFGKSFGNYDQDINISMEYTQG